MIYLVVSNFVVVGAQFGMDAGRVDNFQAVPFVRRRSLRSYRRADFNLRAREHFNNTGFARAVLPNENKFNLAAVIGKSFGQLRGVNAQLIKFLRHVAQKLCAFLCKLAKLKFFHNQSPPNNRDARNLLRDFKFRSVDSFIWKSGVRLFGFFNIKIITFNRD